MSRAAVPTSLASRAASSPLACHPCEQRLLVKRFGHRAGIAEAAPNGRDLGADGEATQRPAQPDLQHGGRE